MQNVMDSDKRLPAELTFDKNDVDAAYDYLKENPIEFFKIPYVRAMLAERRLASVSEDQIITFDPKGADIKDFTIKHNKTQLMGGAALFRPSLLINPLLSIDYVWKNAAQMKILSVGPRTEAEIFALIGGGFLPQNISALDLISYSKFIDLGDMHAMPYSAGSFDVVILGWVIGYSDNPEKVISETLRIAKPGAFICIGGEFNPNDRNEETAERYDRYWHRTQTLIEMFGDKVDAVIFRSDVHPEMTDEVHHVMVIFRLEGTSEL